LIWIEVRIEISEDGHPQTDVILRELLQAIFETSKRSLRNPPVCTPIDADRSNCGFFRSSGDTPHFPGLRSNLSFPFAAGGHSVDSGAAPELVIIMASWNMDKRPAIFDHFVL
jgi:hypothetical protein